jgi:hypothetical protein
VAPFTDAGVTASRTALLPGVEELANAVSGSPGEHAEMANVASATNVVRLRIISTLMMLALSGKDSSDE